MNATVPPKSAIPTVRSRFRRLPKILLFDLLLLFTLVFLGIAFENWRGRRAWRAYSAEAAAKGVKLNLADVIPPAIPDESNVAAVPMLAALLDYQRDAAGQIHWAQSNLMTRVRAIGDLYSGATGLLGSAETGGKPELQKLEEYLLSKTNLLPNLEKGASPALTILAAAARFEPEVITMAEALRRPDVRFPVHYPEGFDMLLPHLTVAKGFSRLALMKSAAFLALNNSEAASSNILFSLRLGEIVGADPFLIAALVQMAVDQQSINGIYEGIAGHQWSEPQLRSFESALGRRDPFDRFSAALGLERAASNDYYERWRQGLAVPSLDTQNRYQAWTPRAITYQNQLRQNRFYDAIDVEAVKAYGLVSFEEHSGMGILTNGFYPYRMVATMLAPAIHNCVRKTVKARATLDMALLACALERRRLALSSYPETMSELVPDFVTKIPQDAASGGDLHYRRESADRFTLYSVGQDLKDDQGAPGKGDQGDWVWRWPASN